MEANYLPKTSGLNSISSYNLALQWESKKALRFLKIGIWIYFALLLIEGALRKWFLPFLATPLLVVRDPIAIWLMVYAYLHGYFKGSFYISAMYTITLLSLFFALTVGHGNLFVALYGARITIIHFPVIFLIGQIFNHQDIEKMGKVILYTVIVQTLIIGLQFYSPQSAWINKGIGGEEVVGFTGGLGFFRPSGTFSFTNGLAYYYGLVAPIILYFWLTGAKYVPKWLIVAATVALISAIPLSISRTVLFEVLISASFAVIIALQKPKMIVPVIGAAIGLTILLFILSEVGFFKTGLAAFEDRVNTASDFKQSGVLATAADRFLGGMLVAIENSDDSPFWGMGLGLGTNAGAQMLTGNSFFLISEGEWGRVIGEMGIVIGMAFIFLRTSIGFKLVSGSFRLIKRENYLPWMLVSFSFILFIQGQWAQPTALGFAVVSTGLTIAAFKKPTVQT